MEPLLHKLARQKPVRAIFETIRRWDKESQKSPNVPPFRFIGLTICGMALVLGLFIYGVLLGSSDDSQSDSFISYGPSIIRTVIWTVIAWPFFVAAFIFQGDPPISVLFVAWVLTGMFWAAVIELFVKWKGRKKPN
jgi:hypothetical protein